MYLVVIGSSLTLKDNAENTYLFIKEDRWERETRLHLCELTHERGQSLSFRKITAQGVICSWGYLWTPIFSLLLPRANTLLFFVIGVGQVVPWTFSGKGVDKLVKKTGTFWRACHLVYLSDLLNFHQSYWGMQKHVQRKAWEWGEAESDMTGSSSPIKEIKKKNWKTEKEKVEILV